MDHEVSSIVELIAVLKATHAIIWIEHIPHALHAVADRIMVLHFGRKLLDGPLPKLSPVRWCRKFTWECRPMLLEVNGLSAFYGDLRALQNVCVHIDTGESVALVGANGAGKTTFLRCLAGLINRKSGSIRFNGSDISRRAAEDIARLGIVLAPEGRLLFPSLNVEENLLMGRLCRRVGFWDLRRVYSLFPL